jgi:hypothetical protein
LICTKTKGTVVGGTFASRLPFLFAVAFVAAGLGDPVVESVSNTGIFGHYIDNNHLGVVPTLLAGTVVIAEVLVLRFVEAWRRSTNRSRNSFVDIARDFGSRSVARDFPLIFALQLISVFALESGEQLVAGGKLLGGTAWLGGPILFSLIAHAIIGGLCTFTLDACMRAIVRALASLVLTAVRFIWLAVARASVAPFRLDRRAIWFARAQAPHVREIGGRAPPLLQTPA